MDWVRVTGTTLIIKVLIDIYGFGKFYPKDFEKPLKYLSRKVQNRVQNTRAKLKLEQVSQAT